MRKHFLLTLLLNYCTAFQTPATYIRPHKTKLFNNDPQYDAETLAKLNESRLNVWKTRRSNIRNVLKFSESLKTFRAENFEDGENEEDTDGTKLAVTLSAFTVAAGAILLRVGGRAALVSTLGLDFASDNPELKDQLDQVLDYATSLGLVSETALFILAWVLVKVFLFDAGGVVLALASGILFGGVIQGAVMSAFAATVGSTVAFGLAKVESPVRKKALELLDEYPSLRGVEKVVAKDGIKAVLTLRLAPVLPIPIGMYNYIYGVTNVPLLDFCAGIFLGSLKPYLLDSYLGYFGKSVVDGSLVTDSGAAGDMQDILLLSALGFSVLIGTFASQLAGETFESITQEIEAEKLAKGEHLKYKPFDKFLGIELPKFIVDFQIGLHEADEKLLAVVASEFDAKVWNYTKPEDIPRELDPSLKVTSPELADTKGFKFGEQILEGIMLTPVLWSTLVKYSDPAFAEESSTLDTSYNNETVTTASGDVSDPKINNTMTEEIGMKLDLRSREEANDKINELRERVLRLIDDIDNDVKNI